MKKQKNVVALEREHAAFRSQVITLPTKVITLTSYLTHLVESSIFDGGLIFSNKTVRL